MKAIKPKKPAMKADPIGDYIRDHLSISLSVGAEFGVDDRQLFAELLLDGMTVHTCSIDLEKLQIPHTHNLSFR